MRNSCIKIIEDSLKSDTSIKPFFMTGDLGFSVLEKIADHLKDKFLNVGIAEANMMSLAAAIANDGRKVFTYSIVPFTSFRCLEQIRNDICYHDCDVTIIGVGVGYGYGYLGPSHHAIDDARVMASIANLAVYSPNDCRELAVVMDEIIKSKKPKYLRLGKGGEGIANLPEPKYVDGAFIYGRKDARVSVFVIGTLLSEVESAVSADLIDNGDVNIISIARLRDFPQLSLFQDYIGDKVLLAQELSYQAGFSDKLYSEITNLKKKYIEFKVCSAPDEFATQVGGTQFLRKKCGLTAENLFQQIRLLNKNTDSLVGAFSES